MKRRYNGRHGSASNDDSAAEQRQLVRHGEQVGEMITCACVTLLAFFVKTKNDLDVGSDIGFCVFTAKSVGCVVA